MGRRENERAARARAKRANPTIIRGGNVECARFHGTCEGAEAARILAMAEERAATDAPIVALTVGGDGRTRVTMPGVVRAAMVPTGREARRECIAVHARRTGRNGRGRVIPTHETDLARERARRLDTAANDAAAAMLRHERAQAELAGELRTTVLVDPANGPDILARFLPHHEALPRERAQLRAIERTITREQKR